jgi:hypothetical protein
VEHLAQARALVQPGQGRCVLACRPAHCGQLTPASTSGAVGHAESRSCALAIVSIKPFAVALDRATFALRVSGELVVVQ